MSERGWWGDKIIICLTSDGLRRHKNWCIHYDAPTKQCQKTGYRCCGSAHCEWYVCADGSGPVEPDIVPPYVPKVTPSAPPIGEEKHYHPAYVPGHYATYGDNLLGKVVIMKLTGGKVAFGEVLQQDRESFLIERDDGTQARYMKIQSIRAKSLWVVDTFSDLTK